MTYDRPTRLLHMVIAAGIAVQMVLSLVMEEPHPDEPPPGMLFEAHEILGAALLGLLVAHWLWVAGRSVARGEAFLLVPWFSRRRLAALAADLRAMGGEIRRGRMPQAETPRPAAAALQGLGLLIATVLAATGVALLAGMEAGQRPGPVLHAVKEIHEAFGPWMWAYLALHPAIAVAHHLADGATLRRMFSLSRFR